MKTTIILLVLTLLMVLANFIIIARVNAKSPTYEYSLMYSRIQQQDSARNIIYSVYDGDRFIGNVKANQLDSLIEMDNQ